MHNKSMCGKPENRAPIGLLFNSAKPAEQQDLFTKRWLQGPLLCKWLILPVLLQIALPSPDLPEMHCRTTAYAA